MRGNDQPVVDVTVCTRSGRKRLARPEVRCEGGLDEVRNARGDLIGFRCRKCGAHHDEQRRLIKEPTE